MYPLGKSWDSASLSASSRKPSRASAAPAPASPPPTGLPVEQQTVEHPPNQVGLRDPEVPRRRLQRPLVFVAYVKLLPDHIHIMYIARCHRKLCAVGDNRDPGDRGDSSTSD